MIEKARSILSNEYSIEGFNCADFTEEVMKVGQIEVRNIKREKYGLKFTSPDLQFEYVRSHNKGSFLEKGGN